MNRSLNQAKTPRDSRRARKREEIIKKAAALFEQHGYRAVSVDTIAEDVGISKPTFYSYLESKDQILWEIYESIGFDTRKSARAIAGSELGAREKLLELIHSHIDYLAPRREFFAVFFQTEAELPKRLQTKLKQVQSEYQKAVEEIFQQGIQEGVFRDVNPKIAALGLIGMCNWLYKWYAPSGALSPSQIADNFYVMITGQSPSTGG